MLSKIQAKEHFLTFNDNSEQIYKSLSIPSQIEFIAFLLFDPCEHLNSLFVAS